MDTNTNVFNTFITLDENKVKDLWIHELHPEKDISDAICIATRKDSRLIMCGCEDPELRDKMKCYLFVYENGNVRPITNEELVYEINHIKFNLYARANDDGFVYEFVTDKIDYIADKNDVFVERTCGDMNYHYSKYLPYDQNGYYNYRIEDGKMVEIPLQEKIESVKISKISQFQGDCYAKVSSGFYIGEDHYSLEQEDQINIQSLYITASRNGAPLLYHADGQIVREYSKEEVFTLFDKMEEVKNKNLTLFNYLKATINESDDAEFINSMEFSEEFLSDKYKELLNK